jgi:pimeloyl-ACP methyl ester carboxylesterase
MNNNISNYVKTLDLPNSVKISYIERQGDKDTAIVFIHGFGSSKEHFRYAFSSSSLEDFTLIAFDLIGFGQSAKPDEFGYSMTDQASIVVELLNTLKIDSFHLCGHSMGGLVGASILELEPQRVLSFIDLEGNLTIEDCFISGRIANSTFKEFNDSGRVKIEKQFNEAAAQDLSMKEYVGTFGMASSLALYKSACHTIAESKTPIVEKLIRFKNVCYIYGEKNRGLFPGEKRLQASGIPIYYIENAGHSMAIENPERLFRVIRVFIDNIVSTKTSG